MKQAIIDAKNKLVRECEEMGLPFDKRSRLEELAHDLAKAVDSTKNGQHEVKLSNGQIVLLEERQNALSIAAMDKGDVDAYICLLTADGVLTYPNSGPAGEYLTSGLPVFKPLDKVYWNDPDNGACSKHGTVDLVNGDTITLEDGTECLASELSHD